MFYSRKKFSCSFIYISCTESISWGRGRVWEGGCKERRKGLYGGDRESNALNGTSMPFRYKNAAINARHIKY